MDITRRQDLRTGTAGGFSFLTTRRATADVLRATGQPRPPTRLAFVGCGHRAQYLLQCLRAVGGISVTAACDIQTGT